MYAAVAMRGNLLLSSVNLLRQGLNDVYSHVEECFIFWFLPNVALPQEQLAFLSAVVPLGFCVRLMILLSPLCQ